MCKVTEHLFVLMD